MNTSRNHSKPLYKVKYLPHRKSATQSLQQKIQNLPKPVGQVHSLITDYMPSELWLSD